MRVITRLNIGGPALQCTLLTERLDPERYDCRLVTGMEDHLEGNYLTLQRKSLTRLVMVPALGREIRVWQDLAVVLRLSFLIRKFRPQILHTHTAKAGTVGRLAAWLAGVPVVVHTFHGHVFRGYFPPLKSRVLMSVERWLARRTDRLIAVSNRVRGELLDLGIGNVGQFITIPLGLDLKAFLSCERIRGQLRAELGIHAGVPLVGIVARLVPIKRHECFLQSAGEIIRRYPESRFVLVGDGERREELKDLAGHLGLEGRVHFLGWRDDLDRVYADLDVVALTSRNEGFPVSLIEAMASGVPVVATRVGGVPDLVEDGVTGLLVPCDDPTSLAAAVSGLLADPERRRTLGQSGRQRVYPAFSAERLLQDMDALYTELLVEKGVRIATP